MLSNLLHNSIVYIINQHAQDWWLVSAKWYEHFSHSSCFSDTSTESRWSTKGQEMPARTLYESLLRTLRLGNVGVTTGSSDLTCWPMKATSTLRQTHSSCGKCKCLLLLVDTEEMLNCMLHHMSYWRVYYDYKFLDLNMFGSDCKCLVLRST